MKWTSVDDSKLLVGVYQYGLGNWDSIKDDSEIGLTKKVVSFLKRLILFLGLTDSSS